MVGRRSRGLAGRQFRELGVALEDDRNERTNPHDAMSRIVPEPFQNGDNQFGSRARIPHGRKNLGVKKSCDAVGYLEIHPADGFTVAKSDDAVV